MAFYLQSKFYRFVQTDRVAISRTVTSQIVVICQLVRQKSFVRVLRRQIKGDISADTVSRDSMDNGYHTVRTWTAQ
jgi:hypothetical protein